MEYSFRLTNPRDYLHLLYCVAFNLQALPTPEQREERIILALQALALTTGGNLLIGALAQGAGWPFGWSEMICGCVIGLWLGALVGLLTTFTATHGEKLTEAVEMGVRFGLPASLGLGILSGLADATLAGLASGAALSRTVSSRLSGATGAVFGALASLVGGFAGGVAVGLNEACGRGTQLGYLSGIGVSGLIWFLGGIIATGLAVGVERLSRARSARLDCLGSLGLLVVLSLAVWVLLDWLLGQTRQWLPETPPAPHWLLTMGTIVLFYGRFLLWLPEAAWGKWWWRRRWRRRAGGLVVALRQAYFDHHMILPLWGETNALRQLAEQDSGIAVKEAIELARFSGHYLAAVSALQTFASDDPLGVQAHIEAIPDERDRNRLLRYVVHDLAEAPARAWNAQQKINAINAEMQFVFNPIAGKFEEDPGQRKIFRPRATAPADSVTESSRQAIIERARGELAEVVPDFRTEPKSRMRHVADFGAVYRSLVRALESKTIADIGGFTIPTLNADAPHLITPVLQQVLSSLNQLAAIAQSYATTTSAITQRDVLLQANERLEAIADQIRGRAEMFGTFGPWLFLLVLHWRQLLTTVGGELAREEQMRPVSNPYVYGNPVLGQLFVGREDVMRHLQAEWGHSGQCSSVVIYGHRRMGKSSILQNLGVGDRFGNRTVIVDFNMQRVGHVERAGELPFYLARKLHDVCVARGLTGIEEPREDDFLRLNPYVNFDRFLSQLDRARGDHRFIITVDEFELIEKQIKDGRLEPQLLDHWRGTFTTYHWFIMAFAGLHTLDEMRRDYWSPLFACVHAIEVDVLKREAAEQLITQPSPDFAIDYAPEAVKKIIELTGGQPYLIQLICHTLVIYFNRQVFEQARKRERCFALADVEAVIETLEFKRESSAYFNGVWGQAQERAEQIAVLKALRDANMSAADIVMKTGQKPSLVHQALDTLSRRRIVALRHDKYRYTVPLMRDWVARKTKSENYRTPA